MFASTSGKVKTYIGIMMLLISVVFTVPFSWLHHCEYSHAHARYQIIKATETAVLSAERSTCPLCELEFPLYLVSDFSYQAQLETSFPEFYIEIPRKIFSATFSDFRRRGPPLS